MVAMLESLMYEVSNIFLTPVLILIVGLFLYAFFQVGIFLTELFHRTRHHKLYEKHKESLSKRGLKGYPIYCYSLHDEVTDMDMLELFAFKRLETTSIVTRVAPMLGLVATMIPMGPALKALSNGNVQGISENLIIAFAAVIFALITASITYWITMKRKGWYAQEIAAITRVKSR